MLIAVLLLNQWFATFALACPLNQMSKAASSESSSPWQAGEMTTHTITDNAAMHHNTTMPCHSMDKPNQLMSVDAEPAMQNTAHSASPMDCCGDNCHCPGQACFSLLLVNAAQDFAYPKVSGLVDHYRFSSLTSSPNHLSKPPQFS